MDSIESFSETTFEVVVVEDNEFMADQRNSFSHVELGEFLTAQ